MATRSQVSWFCASCTKPDAPLQEITGGNEQTDVVLTELHIQIADWLRAAASVSHLLRSAIFTYLLLMKSGCCSASASSMDATFARSTAAAAAAASASILLAASMSMGAATSATMPPNTDCVLSSLC